MSATVDAYDTSLTRSAPEALNAASYYFAGGNVGGYAVFAGGETTTVTAYNASLTRSAPEAISSNRYYLASASVGNYALFAGGSSSNSGNMTGASDVYAYNTSLTRTTVTALSAGRTGLAGASLDGYALFAGGATSTTTMSAQPSATVDAYDTSLTRTTATTLNTARYWLTSANVGEYAVFAGGTTNGASGETTVTDAYTVQ